MSVPMSTPYSNLMPSALEDRDAAVDHRLRQLRVRHAEAHQAARALVALVDGHEVARLVQLGGDREAGRAGADDADRLAGATVGRLGDDPALLVGALDDRQLDLLDRDRVVVDGQHARRLARRRADPARELGEVVGRVQLDDRVLPAVAEDEVVPVGDQVPERAALVAERDAAVHAAGALLLELLLRLEAEVLVVVVDPLLRVALVEADTLDSQETAKLTHVRVLLRLRPTPSRAARRRSLSARARSVPRARACSRAASP